MTEKTKFVRVPITDDLYRKLKIVKDIVNDQEEKEWSYADLFIEAFESKFDRVMSQLNESQIMYLIKELADVVGIELKGVTRELFDAMEDELDEDKERH